MQKREQIENDLSQDERVDKIFSGLKELKKPHKKCRSLKPDELTPYQSNIDRLRSDQIIYVRQFILK